jgi:hypothetical protein
MQQFMFKLTMKALAAKAMVEPFNMNLITKLWETLPTIHYYVNV